MIETKIFLTLFNIFDLFGVVLWVGVFEEFPIRGRPVPVTASLKHVIHVLVIIFFFVLLHKVACVRTLAS